MILPPRIITNSPRDTIFSPLDSAVSGAGRPDFLGDWTRRVPPRIIGRTVEVPAHAFTVYRPNLWVPITNIALPYPMPCSVLMHCYFRRDWVVPRNMQMPDRRPFWLDIIGTLQAPPCWIGGILVVWGLGEATSYALLDLSEQSLNIPMAQSVEIYAQIPTLAEFTGVTPDSSIVSAWIAPGHQHIKPTATKSSHIYASETGAVFGYKFPHCKRLAINLWSSDVNGRMQVTWFNSLTLSPIPVTFPIASYLIQPAVIGNQISLPYPVNTITAPAAGGLAQYLLTVPPPVGQNFTTAEIIELIEP